MKKVNVELSWNVESLDELFPWEEDKKQKEEIEKLLGVHEITLFDDYVKLLEKLSELIDGEFRVYNNGTYIALFE